MNQLPRMYLATAHEVAQELRGIRNGIGDSVLNEDWQYKRGAYKGTYSRVPQHWRFSKQRVEQLLTNSVATLGVAAKP